MGEDWGKNNLANAYVAMKNFQMLPLDTTITNTENAMSFQHYQVLNLEQTNRLLSRVNLASYFKNQAFEVIGLNPQRMGQQIAQQQTATGIEQAMNASYAQTEQYFTQHSDYLMPRVHQMRTDLAQFYHSQKPSLRLQYITTNDEKVNFQINGTDLLMRDFNIFCTTKTNQRQVMEQLRSLAMNNNTTGASIYDLGNVIKSESVAELTGVLKDAEQKNIAQKQAEMQQQQQMQQELLASQERQKQMDLQFKSDEAEKDRQNDVLVAEIRAAGYGAMMDLNENKVSDFNDSMKEIRQSDQYREQMSFKREQEINKSSMNTQKIELERQRLQTQREIADKQLEVARENKNKYDVAKKDKKSK
jgi:hypothetical protein